MYILCVYTFFLNLTKLVFSILPVASNVVHASRKHPLSLHLDCPHVMSRDLQCYFKYSFSKCKLKSCVNCFVILFLLVNKTLREQSWFVDLKRIIAFCTNLMMNSFNSFRIPRWCNYIKVMVEFGASLS